VLSFGCPFSIFLHTLSHGRVLFESVSVTRQMHRITIRETSGIGTPSAPMSK
jgi:hypothetical protein